MTIGRAIRRCSILAAIGAAAMLAGQAPRLGSISVAAAPVAPPSGDFAPIAAFLQAHCLECHNDKKHKGDISLEIYHDRASVLAGREVFEQVLEKLDAG